MNKYKLSLAVGSAMALIVGATPAFSENINEVVVTANKREQSLSDVGLAISAMSGDDLKLRRIANGADLALETPGLNFTPSPNSTPVYTLRGVGFFESSLAAYPDVSLYIDQAPLPFPSMAGLVAFDLERAEILKGPQGTLFGNNATGGAINYIAAKPTDEFSAGFDLTYGRFDTKEIEGYVSGPLTDTLRGRLAIKTVDSDGWQKSYDNGQENGAQDNTAVRLMLDWDASEDLALSLRVEGWEDKNDPQAPQRIKSTPQYLPGAAGFGGVLAADFATLVYPNPKLNNRDAGWTPGYPQQDNDFWQTSLRADYQINDNLTLTSITSYAELDYKNGTDGDGTYLNSLDIVDDVGDIETFSQELRLANDPSNALRWVVGVNYETSEVNQVTSLTYPDTTSFAVNGITVSEYDSFQEMDNFAVFANMEFDFAEQLTLKLGVRQTTAERDGLGSNHNDLQIDPSDLITPSLSLTEFFNAVYGAVYGIGTVPTIGEDESIVLDTRAGSSTFLQTGEPVGKLDEDSTSWSIGLDFKATEDLLFYANISQGYKAGSFPHVSGAIYKAYQTVDQESLLDYEVGFKATMYDGKLMVNGGAFFYDYEDKQLRAKFVDPIFGALDLLENVPESEATGAELEITAFPIDGLVISAAVTYLDTEVIDYVGSVGAEPDPNNPGLLRSIDASFEGADLPYAPQWSFNLRGDYTFALTDELEGMVGVSFIGQSESIGILTPDSSVRKDFEIRDYTIVNANIGIRSVDERWQVMLWGKNITDEYYWQNTIQAYDDIVRYAARPAEYGVTFSMNF
jgi:outer membrane receptor protein involved in Fe transport